MILCHQNSMSHSICCATFFALVIYDAVSVLLGDDLVVKTNTPTLHVRLDTVYVVLEVFQ